MCVCIHIYHAQNYKTVNIKYMNKKIFPSRTSDYYCHKGKIKSRLFLEIGIIIIS